MRSGYRALSEKIGIAEGSRKFIVGDQWTFRMPDSLEYDIDHEFDGGIEGAINMIDSVKPMVIRGIEIDGTYMFNFALEEHFDLLGNYNNSNDCIYDSRAGGDDYEHTIVRDDDIYVDTVIQDIGPLGKVIQIRVRGDGIAPYDLHGALACRNSIHLSEIETNINEIAESIEAVPDLVKDPSYREDFEFMGEGDECIVNDNVLMNYRGSDDDIVLPEGITGIGDSVFSGSQITSIVIPEGVIWIGERAFENCFSLTEVTMPSTIENIGAYAFVDCHELRRIDLGTKLDKIENSVFSECYKLENVTIPERVKRIEAFAFKNCRNFDSITLPGKTTYIGPAAFASCCGLRSVHLSGNVTEIDDGMWGDSPFSDCDVLEIECAEGSYAEEYCISHDIRYTVYEECPNDDKDDDDILNIYDDEDPEEDIPYDPDEDIEIDETIDPYLADPYEDDELDGPHRRIKYLIEDKEWEKATENCENLLNTDPEDYIAYYFLFMIDLKAHSYYTLLKNYGEKIMCGYDVDYCELSSMSNYRRAYSFADDIAQIKMESIIREAAYLKGMKCIENAETLYSISNARRYYESGISILEKVRHLRSDVPSAIDKAAADMAGREHYEKAEELENTWKKGMPYAQLKEAAEEYELAGAYGLAKSRAEKNRQVILSAFEEADLIRRESSDERQLRKAYDTFRLLEGCGYDRYADMIEKKIQIEVYRDGMKLMKDAPDIKDLHARSEAYRNAGEKFSRSRYKDYEEKMQMCDDAIFSIRVEEACERYREARNISDPEYRIRAVEKAVAEISGLGDDPRFDADPIIMDAREVTAGAHKQIGDTYQQRAADPFFTPDNAINLYQEAMESYSRCGGSYRDDPSVQECRKHIQELSLVKAGEAVKKAGEADNEDIVRESVENAVTWYRKALQDEPEVMEQRIAEAKALETEFHIKVGDGYIEEAVEQGNLFNMNRYKNMAIEEYKKNDDQVSMDRIGSCYDFPLLIKTLRKGDHMMEMARQAVGYSQLEIKISTAISIYKEISVDGITRKRIDDAWEYYRNRVMRFGDEAFDRAHSDVIGYEDRLKALYEALHFYGRFDDGDFLIKKKAAEAYEYDLYIVKANDIVVKARYDRNLTYLATALEWYAKGSQSSIHEEGMRFYAENFDYINMKLGLAMLEKVPSNLLRRKDIACTALKDHLDKVGDRGLVAKAVDTANSYIDAYYRAEGDKLKAKGKKKRKPADRERFLNEAISFYEQMPGKEEGELLIAECRELME